jgi:uncharacterized membrane protein
MGAITLQAQEVGMDNTNLTLKIIRSQRVHYRPGEIGAFEVKLGNSVREAASGVLAWQVVSDVERPAAQGEIPFAVLPGSETTLVWKASLDAVRYGAEIRGWIAGRPDTTAAGPFGVSADVGTVGMLGGSRYANYTDEFAWAPDDFGNMAPVEKEWWAGQIARHHTKEALCRKFAEGHARGVKSLTYAKGVSGGRDGLRLLLEKPGWAAFNRFGQLGGLDMSFDVWSLKHWDDPDRKWGFWNCWTPNFLLDEPVRYGAEEIVRSVRMFGWDGARFDGQFDIFGGFDVAGNPLPAPGAERSAINAANVTLMKTHIRKRLPNFTFGYNYGAPQPTPSALDRAVSAGGGLIMDEGIRNAIDPQHPLQAWRQYARHILEESARIRGLGGVPLIFGSELKGMAADYGIGFCLAGGGTPYNWNFSNGTRAYDAFATRYSELLWNPVYKFAGQPDSALRVSSDGNREIWWRDWVRSGRASDGTPRLIIHLFNPPPAPTIRATTNMPPPATGVRVMFNGVAASDAPTAWLLTCDTEPRLRRLSPAVEGNACSVEVGQIDHWGILVLEGKAMEALSEKLALQEMPMAADPRMGVAQAKPLPTPLDIKPFTPNESEGTVPGLACELKDGRMLLANRHVRFIIDPKHGGRISSFVDLRDGLERVVPGRLEGLFFDTVYDQDGMLYQGQWSVQQSAPYAGAILENSPTVARIRVSRAAFDSEHGVPNTNYSGLVIEREFQLGRDSTTLDCVVRLRNTSAEGRCPAYALRNGYVDGLQRGDLRAYRPSRRGIHPAGPGLPGTDPMIWDPAAGWTATADMASGRGAAWLMEAGRVMMFYNSTAEVTPRLVEEFPNRYGVDPLWIWDNASDTAIGADWYYRRAFIPAGGVWETRVTLVPLQEVRAGIAYADPFVVAAASWSAESNQISVQALPSSKPFAVERAVVESDQGDMELRREGGGNRFTGGGPEAASEVVRIRLEGRTADGSAQIVRFPFVPKPADITEAPLLSGPTQTPDYRSPVPVPVREGSTRKALLLEGLGFERWGVATNLAGRAFETRSSEFMKRRIATAVRYFPATLEEAQRFDVIVLGAVDAFALSNDGVSILRDYVSSGGSLLVLGGLYSYGGGRFQEFGLDEWLPLRVKRTFDLVQSGGRAGWEKEDWQKAGGTGRAPKLGRIAWMHDLEPAPGAEVWARIGESPLIAVQTLGKGRIAAVAATPLGDPEESGAFWTLPEWNRTLDSLLTWLVKEP